MDRFILVQILYNGDVKTIIGSFDDVCNETERQLNLGVKSKVEKAIIYDRKYSDSGLDLNCYEEVNDRILYSQFIDSYYGDNDL